MQFRKRAASLGVSLAAALVISACQQPTTPVTPTACDPGLPALGTPAAQDTPSVTETPFAVGTPTAAGTPVAPLPAIGTPQVSEPGPEAAEVVNDMVERWWDLDSFATTANVTSVDTATSAATASSFSGTARIWFEKPDNFRMEMTETSDALADGAVTTFDGGELWIYLPSQRQAFVVEGSASVFFVGRTPVPFLRSVLQVMELPQFLENLDRNSEVTVVGRETVNGELTTIVEARASGDEQRFGTHRLWVSEQTNLPVRVQMNRPNGQTFFDVVFTDFEPDVAIPAGQFTFSPPADAQVQRVNLDQLTLVLGWRDVTLDQARSEAGFPVLVPDTLPTGLEQRAVRLGSANGEAAVAIIYQLDGRDHTILVENQALAETPELPGSEVLEIDGQPVEMLRFGDSILLTWVDGQTRLTLISDYTQAEAMEFARSIDS